jgi:hypothetical protein
LSRHTSHASTQTHYSGKKIGGGGQSGNRMDLVSFESAAPLLLNVSENAEHAEFQPFTPEMTTDTIIYWM